MAAENEDVEGDGGGDASGTEVFIRLRGRAAVRFRQLLKRLNESDDLHHIKLGNMNFSGLGAYGLCEWMQDIEGQLDSGGRR